MQTILIRCGRIIDPSQGVDNVADLPIQAGRIKGIDQRIHPPDGAAIL